MHKKGWVTQLVNATTIILLILTSCGQGKMKTPKDAMTKFEEFNSKLKFTEDNSIMYPGIMDAEMRPILTKKINQAADDFNEVANADDPSDKKYHDKIKIGLARFSGLYLDTEDRERVALYFEELMHIVGLETSNGLLNDFIYGFDPSELPKEK